MRRQPELTSLRGLAALWVFIYHIPIYLGIPSLYWMLSFPIVSSGYLGVPVFFILSISLLLRSLDENPSMEHYFTRRIKRTWPMYFFTVAFIFLYYSHSLTWLLEQSTFTAVFIDNQSIQYVFWSLQIEEVAYLFFPLVHRLSAEGKLKLSVALYLVSAVAFCLILKMGLTASLWWLPLSLSSYALGISVYLKRIPMFTIALIIPAFFYWDIQPLEMASFLVAPGFAYVVQEASRIKPLRWRPLVWVGDNSYGLYLVHPLLLSTLGALGVVFTLPVAWVFERANSGFVNIINKRNKDTAVRPR